MKPAKAPVVFLIAGPTASGKSALALNLAERLGGEIVNADALQIYRDLRLLTARPSPREEERAPFARPWPRSIPRRPIASQWVIDSA